MSANVSDVLQFLFVLQHFLLPQLSLLICIGTSIIQSAGNVIEFPSSCTLLEAKRSTQLLHLTMQQVSANMTCARCFRHLSYKYVNTHLLFFTKYRQRYGPNLLSSCMFPLRGTSMCLVRHLTASAMSTLFLRDMRQLLQQASVQSRFR